DYDWNERNNPCHSSYYTTERWASLDMLASNIGLIAKRGNDNSMTVVATDILTARPLRGVDVKLLDYQQQVIQTATTDEDGIAYFKAARRPFTHIAPRKEERGYFNRAIRSPSPILRVDVAGDVSQKAINSFLYADRGAWLPAHSLYVTIVRENQAAS